MKRIGIIGITGRMGALLAQSIKKSNTYELGLGYSKTQLRTLNDVFMDNDCIVDFSTSEITHSVIEAATRHPKPLIICVTGWDRDSITKQLAQLTQTMPVVIAPNTSVGACIQQYISSQLARLLDSSYDVDILDRHHRHKVDSPSGTAHTIIDGIKQAKREHCGVEYSTSSSCRGPRQPNCIGITSERAGNIPGEHIVTFTGNDDTISIRHAAFNRDLFANGAIRIIDWLKNTRPKPGIYSMPDVIGLSY